ncbi:MAG: family 20 glycosylhydrolase [Lachnospiraceae bacterium]|nr:family 20 glycosylhydrolase [Lachnospiraceae bacterium]
MKKKPNKKAIAQCFVCLLVLAGLIFVTKYLEKQGTEKPLFHNLAEEKGTKITAYDNAGTSPCYMDVEFTEERQVSYIRILWAGLNADQYQLEASSDGVNYTVLEQFTEASYLKEQLIELPETVTAKHIRLAVSQAGAVPQETVDAQEKEGIDSRIPVKRMELYKENPWNTYFKELKPILQRGAEGFRQLVTAELPKGFQVSFAGCDLEQVIGADETVYDTLSEKTVHIGYQLTYGDWTVDSPSYEIRVPASNRSADQTSADSAPVNEKPAVLPDLQEWKGSTGAFTLTTDSRILVTAGTEEIADALQQDLLELTGIAPTLVTSEGEKPETGDIVLQLIPASDGIGLGVEGYLAEITDSLSLSAEDPTGLYWSTRTVLQILKNRADIEEMACTLPKGTIRDYPQYPVRGFQIDVARNSVSMDTLRDIAKNMAWYKMNNLTIHLNDNALLAYSDKKDTIEMAFGAYSAFRLESSITGSKGKALTAPDMSYGKEEFASFIREAKSIGVSVVPEIDTPAHSLSLTSAFPELSLATMAESVDMLDLSKPESETLVKDIWSEYLESDEQTSEVTFADSDTLHIGADEYYGNAENYLTFENSMIDFIHSFDKKVRMWGSLSGIRGTGRIQTENVELAIWNTDWADPMTMYRAGFDILNTNSAELYIIPGGGVDYLDTDLFYDTFAVNRFPMSDGSYTFLPEYSPKLEGAVYVMWNDLCDNLAAGISEYDMFDRFYMALPYVSQKCWSPGSDLTKEELEPIAESVLMAPGTDPYAWDPAGDDSSSHIFGTFYEEDFSEPLILKGGNDYQETGLTDMGPVYEITCMVKRTDEGLAGSTQQNQVLFEYGTEDNRYQFKAVQAQTGQVGFSREDWDYSFDYTLPVGEWVELKIIGEKDFTSLYVNGEFIERIGSDETYSEHATFVFPLARIGSETEAFCGEIGSVKASVPETGVLE